MIDMKYPGIFILSSVVLLTVSCHAPVKENERAARALAILQDPASKKVLVASHRGDWRNYPENSIPAIESVIKMGVDIMELDVAMTSDSVLVLCHDGTVNRTTNGRGPVSSFTLDSIKTLKLKRAHGVTTDSLRMPTLEEALTVCKDRILVNVDHGWSYFPQVLEVARKVGCVEQIIFKSGGTRQACSEAMEQCKEAGIVYMPIVTVVRDGTAPTIDPWLDGGEMPVMFEVCFPQLFHPEGQQVHYLHRILRGREYAPVFLEDQFHPFVHEPVPCVLVVKGREHLPHEFVSAWISFIQGRYPFERIGEVAPATAGYRDLGKGLPSAFEYVDAGRREPAPEFDGAEASGSTGSDNRDFHPWMEVIIFLPLS